jgi:hypothetical protein
MEWHRTAPYDTLSSVSAVRLVESFEHQFDFSKLGFNRVEIRLRIVLVARVAHDVNSVGGCASHDVHR